MAQTRTSYEKKVRKREHPLTALPGRHLFFFYDHFIDSTAPTFSNVIDGQRNLKDAIHQRISFTAPNGKQYNIRKDGKVATLLVRYLPIPTYFYRSIARNKQSTP